ncbi:MAG TPA: lysylphosphatidylglycerol synthase transmembrane domain-containing protein [Gemmatimonadales bacterium]|nr:lysylphosphatidylglycerol synthase transmembrane domain-containing protein [Gemmatimonadales bacterium]
MAFRLLVGVAVLALILSRMGLQTIGRGLGPGTLAGVLVAALLLLSGQSIAALRWKVILGPGSPPWGYLARLYVIGGFFSLFLPTAVGGDAVRALAAARETSRPGGVVASVLLDRAMGVFAMICYALVAAALAPSFSRQLIEAARLKLPGKGLILVGVALAVAFMAAIWFGRKSPQSRQGANDAVHLVRELARTPASLMAAIALGFVVQGLYILLWLVLARVMHLPIAPLTLFFAVPVVTAFAMLPITLNGLGVREGAWLLLLGGSGIPPGDIVTFSLLYFAANLITGLVGGVLFMARGTSSN